jgi:hypothetical protein
MTRPARSRKIATGLSAITWDVVRKPFPIVGSIVMRKLDADERADVI